uniref:Peptidase M22 glycoprotease n=1 Tax=Cyanothece sp. (strain PCC 7425 / ATCC 29141) TaxID=395961 RepID=B8HK93_CYAP4
MSDLPPFSGYALGIDTTSSVLVLGLSNFVTPGRWQTWPLGRDLSLYLQDALGEFIQPQTWSDLAWIAVARGPGSFTGTRLGVVTARTLAQQLKLPLFAISNLAATALAAVQTSPTATEIAVESPARQGEVYAAIYKFNPPSELHTIQADQVLKTSEWEEILQTFKGQRVGGSQPTPTATAIGQAMLQLAHHQWQRGDRPDWSSAIPFYN